MRRRASRPAPQVQVQQLRQTRQCGCVPCRPPDAHRAHHHVTAARSLGRSLPLRRPRPCRRRPASSAAGPGGAARARVPGCSARSLQMSPWMHSTAGARAPATSEPPAAVSAAAAAARAAAFFTCAAPVRGAETGGQARRQRLPAAGQPRSCAALAWLPAHRECLEARLRAYRQVSHAGADSWRAASVRAPARRTCAGESSTPTRRSSAGAAPRCAQQAARASCQQGAPLYGPDVEPHGCIRSGRGEADRAHVCG